MATSHLPKASVPAGEVGDPFVTSAAGAAHLRFSDFDASLFTLGPGVSIEQAKGALEARLNETERRMEEAGKLGTQLVQQQKVLSQRLKEVEEMESQGAMKPALRRKLVELEKEYYDVARESARAFLPKQRVLSNEAVVQGSPYAPDGKDRRRSVSPSKLESLACGSPTKLHVPNRKLRNQPANRIHDIEFAAEISTSLISQVRNLQALLAERDEELRGIKNDRARLEVETESLQQRVKTLDESENRFKDENWNLETQMHELLAAQKNAFDREKKLKQTLNALELERSAAQKELDEAKESLGKLDDKHLATVKNLEIELGTSRRNAAVSETECLALQRKVEDLTSQNRELAKAFSLQRGRLLERESGPGVSDEEGETAEDNGTPEHSPPPSPIKATPRHSMLETETLKTSLQHAQRTIQNLRGNVHREKTEKLELRRMLQDARDELEKTRADLPVSRKSSRKLDPREMKKSRLGRLGQYRSSRTETSMDDADWEEAQVPSDDGYGTETEPTPSERLARQAKSRAGRSAFNGDSRQVSEEPTPQDSPSPSHLAQQPIQSLFAELNDMDGSDDDSATEFRIETAPVPLLPRQHLSLSSVRAVDVEPVVHGPPSLGRSLVLSMQAKPLPAEPAVLSLARIDAWHMEPVDEPAPTASRAPSQVGPPVSSTAPLDARHREAVVGPVSLLRAPLIPIEPPTHVLSMASLGSWQMEPVAELASPERPAPVQAPLPVLSMASLDARQIEPVAEAGSAGPRTPTPTKAARGASILGWMMGRKGKEPEPLVIAEDETRKWPSGSPRNATPESQRALQEVSGNADGRRSRRAKKTAATRERGAQTTLTADAIDRIMEFRAGEAAHGPMDKSRTPSSPGRESPTLATPGSVTPRAGRTADAASPRRLTSHSRQSSVSSFASELDSRFNMGPPGLRLDQRAVPGSGDHRMIQAITQTMIGEFLWKYTRKHGRAGMSEKRHRRYFWVHPYTRTLYWSERDPSGAERAELRAKSLPIEAVRVVTDDNVLPPGLHRKSLVIVSPGRSVKFTCNTGQRHEVWFNALSFMLLRTGDQTQNVAHEMAGAIRREDMDDLGPAFGMRPTPARRQPPPPSLSSYNSRATRWECPAAAVPLNMPTLSPSKGAALRHVSHGGTLGKFGGYWKGSLRSRSVPVAAQGIYEASQVHDSAEDVREMIEQQDRAADRLENVRACCDGKHDVGTLTRRGRHAHHDHTHNHAGPSTRTSPLSTIRSRV